MTNSHLGDTVERVGRDPQRKLGWDDRLIGTMRAALAEGAEPRRYALGAAAAAATTLDPAILEGDAPMETSLVPLWRQASPEQDELEAVLDLVEGARQQLKRWRESRFQDPEHLFKSN